jgi:hypothetical protein
VTALSPGTHVPEGSQQPLQFPTWQPVDEDDEVLQEPESMTAAANAKPPTANGLTSAFQRILRRLPGANRGGKRESFAAEANSLGALVGVMLTEG